LDIDSAPPALPEELASMVADGTAIFLTFLRLKGRFEGAGPVPGRPGGNSAGRHNLRHIPPSTSSGFSNAIGRDTLAI